MDGYQEFLLTIRRDINCLTDSDRALRRSAIIKLEKTLLGNSKTPADFIKRVFLEELHKPLFRMFSDQVEKCRELSISITLRFVDLLLLPELENLLPLLLAALLGRLRSVPFPEQSEELRLEVLRLLSHLFEVCKEMLNPFASDILDAVSKALTDSCPDAKKECSEITKKVSLYFDAEKVSRAGTPLVAALLANLKHQQWKVRRTTLDSLGALLSQEAPLLDHMEDVLPSLGLLACDRTSAVRQTLAEVLERWLLKGLTFKTPVTISFDDDGPVGFEKFENRLLLLLLSVTADEDTEQVGSLALGALERVSALKHEVRIKRAESERKREEARRKAKEATEAANGKANGYTDSTQPLPAVCLEPQVVPAFDYSAVQTLLPLPFSAGHVPSVLTTTFVQLHLPTILPQVLSNLTQWTTDIRESAGRILRVVFVIANRQIAPFVDQILVHLYKASSDDEAVVAKSALQCAEMVGAFLEADLVLAVVGKHLGLKIEGGTSEKSGPGFNDLWPEQRKGRALTRTVQDVQNAVKSFVAATVETRRQVFAVLSRLLLPGGESSSSSVSQTLNISGVQSVLRFLEEGALNDELLPWILATTQALLHAGSDGCKHQWPRVFDLLLRMRSGQECSSAIVDANMDHLAKLLDRSRRNLYEEHVRHRLSELLLGADVEVWDERCPKRHILETLLRNAGPAVADHVTNLLPVLSRQCSPEDASAPARVDLLGLVHFLINEEDEALTTAIQRHSAYLLSGILIPNCTWRPGQSNNKIRKGGMVCIHALLRRHLVPPTVLNEAFVDLLPILKSCLDDSWSPDNRMIACLVLSSTLSDLKAEISSEQLREVYPELLKRLDDSNDKIRVAVCEALSVFFKCIPPNWSRTLLEYILRTLFIHLDDPNQEIQQGIYAVLEAAIPKDTATFLREAQVAAAKSTHPRQCEELIRIASQLQKESIDSQIAADGDVSMD